LSGTTGGKVASPWESRGAMLNTQERRNTNIMSFGEQEIEKKKAPR
jgi:hypothetical protein